MLIFRKNLTSVLASFNDLWISKDRTLKMYLTYLYQPTYRLLRILNPKTVLLFQKYHSNLSSGHHYIPQNNQIETWKKIFSSFLKNEVNERVPSGKLPLLNMNICFCLIWSPILDHRFLVIMSTKTLLIFRNSILASLLAS